MANMRLAITIRALILVVGVVLRARTASAGPLLAQEVKLESLQEVAGDQLGQAVSIDGATAIVGSPTQGLEAGAAQVFVHVGASWNQQQELTPDPGDGAFFGAAVAVSGDTAAVGAYGDAANGSFA